MTPRRWDVPVVLGPGPWESLVYVEVATIDGVRVVYELGGVERPLPVLGSLVSCQLGQALQDASRYCGEQRSKRR